MIKAAPEIIACISAPKPCGENDTVKTTQAVPGVFGASRSLQPARRADALGLGDAKVDVAYAGLDAVLDVLSEVKARLVAAEEDGVDRPKFSLNSTI